MYKKTAIVLALILGSSQYYGAVKAIEKAEKELIQLKIKDCKLQQEIAMTPSEECITLLNEL